jgi:hypothetical protein
MNLFSAMVGTITATKACIPLPFVAATSDAIARSDVHSASVIANNSTNIQTNNALFEIITYSYTGNPKTEKCFHRGTEYNQEFVP